MRWPSFMHRLGIFLTFQLQVGEPLGQRKEEEEGRGWQAALQAATSTSEEAAMAAAQAAACVCWEWPHHHSCLFPLQVRLTGSTFWDSRGQSKAIIQFHTEVKTCPLQQIWMTFPLNHHLDLCLWQATIFSYFFLLTMIQNRVGQT